VAQIDKNKQSVGAEVNPEALLLRGAEVARALNVSRALAYKWMGAGILPTVRLRGSRTIRVPKDALLRWIEENTTGVTAQR
jgi:excisionase family DNA binding protein